MDYTAGRGTTALGIIGTALGGLATLGGNLLGGGMPYNNMGCNPGDRLVNRYEVELQQQLAKKDSEIALRDASIFVDQKIAALNDSVTRRFERVEGAINQQAVYNAANNGTIGCIQNQIAQLYGLTKLVVPNTSVCPGWGAVTVAPATAPATAG